MFTVASSFRWLFLVVISSCGQGEEFTNFDGKTYVTYSYNGPPRTLPDDIVIVFKTIKPSGILFHAASSEGDFITLELLRGKIRYSLFVGSMRSVTTGYVIGPWDLADNSEHQVEIKQMETNGTTLTLYVDVDKKIIKIPGFYSRRLAHQTFYVGGVNASQRQKRHWLLRELRTPYVPFEGCLDNKHVKVNGVNLLDLARKKATFSGKLISGCNIAPEGYYPITFKKPRSFIKVMVGPVLNTASYKFKFRTYIGQGILLHQRETTEYPVDILLSLDSGKVLLKVKLGGKSVTLLGGLTSLDDGMWHSVAVDISAKSVKLKVDNKLSFSDCDGSFKTSPVVFVGGNEWGKIGFVGCIRDLIIQGQNITLNNFCRVQVCRNECSLPDLCVPSPCRNGGRCYQQWNQSICDCSGTDFAGTKCEKPAFFMQSCADWYAAGKQTNAYYRINPKHSEPFTVYCNMTNVRGPSTVIFHTRDRNKVKAAQSNPDGKYYHHEIFYESSKYQNIRDLIMSSTHCRQYLQYKCYNSVIFDSPKPFNLNSGRGARWVSRDGHLQDYWPGASEGSMKCACGMNGTCVESSKVCNCDTVDNKWHTDDGYLTDLRRLPVKKILFSVDGTSAGSYYVLGSLECYGSTTIRTTTSGFLPSGSSIVHESTALRLTKRTTKSPDTSSTETSGGKGLITKIRSSAVVSATSGTPHNKNYPSPTEPHTSSTTNTKESLQTDIIVVEATRTYITIHEKNNQQLVLIILSVILALFVIALLVLIMKQNLFYPCKCLKVSYCHEVPNLDTIELHLPSPAEPEILQLEASPYPTRSYHLVSHDGRDSPSLEIYSDDETERLDISNGSSTCNSENADIEKELSEKRTEFEDIDLGLIDLVPFPIHKQFSTEQQIMKLKVIYDVLTTADVTAYSHKKENTTSPSKQYQEVERCRSDTQGNQPLLTSDDQLVDPESDSTASISDISSTNKLSSDVCTCTKEVDIKVVTDESSKENTLTSCKPASENKSDQNTLRSSEPHDNYLSLDVDSHESGTLRRPLTVTRLNGNSRYDEQLLYKNNLRYPHKRQGSDLPNICNGKWQKTKSPKKNKPRRSSPRSHLFSHQKSEEEELLSSTQVNSLIPSKGNSLSDSSKKHLNGVANTFSQTKQQEQQNANTQENQFKERYKKTACAMPLKQPRTKRYETEL